MSTEQHQTNSIWFDFLSFDSILFNVFKINLSVQVKQKYQNMYAISYKIDTITFTQIRYTFFNKEMV